MAGKDASRNRLRSLLGGAKDELPEGWGKSGDNAGRGDGDGSDVDMEITFTPGLSEKKGEDETTLEKYQRKLKEKRKKRKEEAKGKEVQEKKKPPKPLDDFFDADSESEENMEDTKKGKKGKKVEVADEPRTAATVEELALLVESENLNGVARHFDMSAVLKAEKKTGKKGKRGRKDKHRPNDQDTQEDFRIDVEDERFKALHEDHTFAIDPSNPQ